MHLGKNNFPNPSDMNLKYVESVQEFALVDLKDYLSLVLEKILAPQTEVEKRNTYHVLSLMEEVRKRIQNIPVKS